MSVQAEEQRLPARMTEAVAARLPKYVPPPSQPVQPAASPATTGDMDSVEEIFHLPNIRVTTGKLPPEAELAFRTPKAWLDLARKNSPGLGLGPFSRLNDGIALEIQKEEREAGQRAELKDRVLSIAAVVGDDARIKEEIRLMRAATAQPNADWLGRPR